MCFGVYVGKPALLLTSVKRLEVLTSQARVSRPEKLLLSLNAIKEL